MIKTYIWLWSVKSHAAIYKEDKLATEKQTA